MVREFNPARDWALTRVVDRQQPLSVTGPSTGLDEDRLENISKLEKIRQRRRDTVNARVNISDIQVRSVRPEGEFKAQSSESALQRIQTTITDLATLANRYHEHENSGEDNKNNITRLTTNEFTFYPSDKPIDVTEFHGFIQHIERMAEKLSPNLILILSSFPVLGSDRQIHNTVIHVKCGERPKIDVFAKTTVSSKDPQYRGYTLADNKHLTEAEAIPLVPSNDPSSFLMPRNSVVLVETEGGAQFFDAIDICSDHNYAVAKQSLEQEIKERLEHQHLDPIPEQVSQVITSSSVFKVGGSMIGNQLFHADSNMVAIGKQQLGLYRKLTARQLDYLSSDNPRLAFSEDANSLLLSPEFGSSLQLLFLRKRKLDRMLFDNTD